MAYKFANPEHTEVNNITTGSMGIHPGNWMWEEYQEWLQTGGTTEPFETRTPEQIRTDIQKEIWEQIKTERLARNDGGVLVDGYWFHSDLHSRIQYLGLKDDAKDTDERLDTDTLVIDAENVLWKTMSGAFVPMTRKRVKDIVAAVKVLDKRLFKAAEIHRMTMEASADPESYDYSTGWPAKYQDAV